MKKKTIFEFENDDISFYVQEDIGIVRIHSNAFECLADPDKSGQLLAIIDWIEKDPVIKSLMLINEPEAFNKEKIHSFLRKVFKTDEQGNLTNVLFTEKRALRARQLNSFRNIITKLINYQKLLFSALNNECVTPIFGMSLAFDFRFASEDMKFVLFHNGTGTHPAGALPFFLPLYTSRAKAMEILLKCEDIRALEAKELGILNEILPVENFEEHCLEKVKEYSAINSATMYYTKRLSFSFKNELEQYFEVESKMMGY